MTERPDGSPEASDLLSDLLDGMHLATSVLFRGEFRAPWSVATPASCDLLPLLPIRSDQIIPFHIIAEGPCSVSTANAGRVELAAGDAILLPYGDGHRLSGRVHASAVPIHDILPRPPWSAVPVVEHGGDGERTTIICGFLQCEELRLHPILRQLPPLLHMRRGTSAADAWLAGTIQFASSEASKPTAGSRSMLARMTELMFLEVLRGHMQGITSEHVGWFAALEDPVTGTALRLLHAAPRADWSIETLARRTGVSRTVLADRFKHYLDQPPMQYLARWRLQLAADQLRATDQPMKAIADASGYESEAAFSRAFKRHFGAPPSDWRKRGK